MNRGEHVDTIRGVRLGVPVDFALPSDGPVDIFLDDGRIVDIAPSGALPARGAVLEGDGGWILPGLWDHHVHVTQWALAAARVALGDAASAADAARRMGRAVVSERGRRVGAGFRDALWPDRPTLELIDAETGDVPTYLINADVHSVWLNTAAFRELDVSPTPDGMLREEPAFEVSRVLGAVDPAAADVLVDRALREAAARGIVGVVDLDMAWNIESWSRRLASGFDAVRVRAGVYPQHLERAIELGLATGAGIPDASGGRDPLVTVGALKVITDGSLGTRTAACSHGYATTPSDSGILTVGPDELLELLTRATGNGLACAVHAIGDVANSGALDAFTQSGAYGTIEHAQLVAHADLARFGRLGVGASIQPTHAVDDRDIADREWADQTALGYPMRSLVAAGAALLFGSDAPVARLDPWLTITAAVFRTLDERPAWRGHEAVDRVTALRASQRGGTASGADLLAPGGPADLIVCGADPLSADREELRQMPVAATLLGGRLTHTG